MTVQDSESLLAPGHHANEIATSVGKTRQADNQNLKDLIGRLALFDLSKAATACGMEVSRVGASQPKALCPFHDDHDPSLQFYPDKSSARQRYHCFSCGAHGDIFDLVKRLRNCDFMGAVAWIADLAGERLPQKTGRRNSTGSERSYGLLLAQEKFSTLSTVNRKILADWAKSRGISIKILLGAGAGVSNANALSNSYKNDRKALDALQAAGLIYRGGRNLGRSEAGALPIEYPAQIFSPVNE